jgi:hypothetical protein
VGLLVACAVRAEGGFRFTAPPGWTDISASAPPENVAGLDPNLVDYVRMPRVAAAAIDRREQSPTVGSIMMAEVSPTSLEISDKTLSDVVDKVFREERKGSEIELIEKSTPQIGGVDVGRLVIEERSGSDRIRRIAYVLPGGDRTAILSFIVAPGKLAAVTPDADDAARKTLGLTPPRRPARVSSFEGALLGGAIVLLGLFLKSLHDRRSRSVPS